MKLCPLALFALVLTACPGARVPSLDLHDPATMRAVLALEGDAVVAANRVCASVARWASERAVNTLNSNGAKAAADLNRACTVAHDEARDALLVGQDALDAYSDAVDGRVGCAAASGVAGLRRIRDLVAAVSPQPMPPGVAQAEQLALGLVSILGASCPIDGGRDAGR